MRSWTTYIKSLLIAGLVMQCTKPEIPIQVFETAANGNKLTEIKTKASDENVILIAVNPSETYQKIIGFGGSFTKATSHLLTRLSEANRNKVLEAYFGESGAKYSLTRTHIGSSDFSLGNYSYAPVKNDMELKNFSIKEDQNDIIPIIKQAQLVSKDGFKLIASPWTAPPWMKDNNDWKGGKLLPKYYPTWALYFEKYIKAYEAKGIPIWGITVENEPLGNDSNWESMHFSPQEMNDFVSGFLGPQLRASYPDVKILGYDQNRGEELKKWADVMYDDPKAAPYFDGIAIHWYASTFDVFPQSLQYAHNKAPNKYLIQTEACVDAMVPRWNDDAWYWSKEAMDWGWTWAPADQKHLHPKYVPVYRYARDIIGCLNNWVDGWIDWNMVLDKQGGPNWAKNWCIAPVIVDPEKDEVYFTPIYYTMAHFSRFIRPDAVRIGFSVPEDAQLQVTAAQNPDGSIAVIVFNPTQTSRVVKLEIGTKGRTKPIAISAQALQTIVIPA